MKKEWKSLVCALAFAAVMCITFVAQAAPKDLVGKPAPEISLSGVINVAKAPSIASMKGKPILLEFFATWCGPCRRSIPHIDGIFTKYGPKGLQVLSISAEKKDAVAKFVKAQGNGMSYPIGIDDQPLFFHLMRQRRLGGLHQRLHGACDLYV